MQIRNSMSRIFKKEQRERFGKYDTFGCRSKGKINRRMSNKKARRRMKENNKFYEGIEEFIYNNIK